LHQEIAGYRNLEVQDLMTVDTIFRISSMTKPITSVVAMMLWEEGKFDINDPITKWFPQFASMKVVKPSTGEIEAANRQITIEDLLTHRAGFTYSEFHTGSLRENYRSALGGDIDSNCSHEEGVNGLASLPLVSQPGELFN